MQSPSTVIMVRPANFGFDPETATTNAFQQKSEMTDIELKSKVEFEFDQAVVKLRQVGVEVKVFEDRNTPICPGIVDINIKIWLID